MCFAQKARILLAASCDKLGSAVFTKTQQIEILSKSTRKEKDLIPQELIKAMLKKQVFSFPLLLSSGKNLVPIRCDHVWRESSFEKEEKNSTASSSFSNKSSGSHTVWY